MLLLKQSLFSVISVSLLCVQSTLASTPKQTPSNVASSLLKKDSSSKTHTVDQLSSFYLPEVSLRNKSARRAISEVIKQYQLVCFRSGQTPIKFTYDAKSLPDKKLTFSTAGYFTDVLDDIALRLNMNVDLSKDFIKFTPIPDAENQELATKSFRVPPDFLSILSQKSGSSVSAVDSSTVLSQLKKDFNLNESAVLKYNNARSVFTVRANSSDAARLERLVDSITSHRPRQVRTSTKRISISSKENSKLVALTSGQLTKAPLSSGQIQMIMRGVAQSKGSRISTFPSIVSRNGEAALIEICREQGSKLKDWGGVKLAVKASFYGFGIENAVTYEQRPYANQAHLNQGELSTIGRAKINNLSYLPNSNSMILKTHKSHGFSHYLVITSDIIDATGRSIRDSAALPKNTLKKAASTAPLVAEEDITWVDQ